MSDETELTDEEILEMADQAEIAEKKIQRRMSDALMNRCPWLSRANVGALARVAIAEMKLIEAEKQAQRDRKAFRRCYDGPSPAAARPSP